MDIKLYNTNSPNNKLVKELANETSYNVIMKHECNILKPIVRLRSTTDINFNYAYIEQFHRYYFIRDIEIYPNNIYELSLSIDVLMSYKDSILKNKIHVTRANNYDKFANDYQIESKKLVSWQQTISPIRITPTLTKFILITTKGDVAN